MTKRLGGRGKPRLGRPRKKLGPRGTEYRRVFVVGHSLAVTLTPGCARLLGVEGGGTVQVVPHVSGKVIIAPVRMRLGAQTALVNASQEVVYLRRQVLRMKRKLLALPVRQVARGFNQGFLKAYRAELMDVGFRLDALTSAVQELRSLVTARPGSAFNLPPGVHAYESPAPD
jgi:hypothetical protein